MTKRELIKWLEGEKADAIKVARERRDKMQKEAADAIYQSVGIDQFISEMEASFQEIIHHFDCLTERCKQVKGADVSKFHWKLSCAEYLRYVEDISYLREQSESVIRIGECESYQDARKQSIAYFNSVEKTYDDVIQTVKNLPSAKDGLEYLKLLGFNISKILPVEPKKQLPATIRVNVDTNYLIFDKDDAK